MRRYASWKADSKPADADGTAEGLDLPEEAAGQQRVQVRARLCVKRLLRP